MAYLDKVVVNLSSVTLNSAEKCFLSKGLNFVLTPKDPPILDADKGNVVVLLNRHDYLAKINALLDTDIYRPLKSDPPSRHTALSLVRWDCSRD
uniref:Uncharacterized protein n=1 Tax=Trichuris muris TaxID=70415 RepID=A0A5S6QH01_TRIMR